MGLAINFKVIEKKFDIITVNADNPNRLKQFNSR